MVALAGVNVGVITTSLVNGQYNKRISDPYGGLPELQVF